MRRLLFTIVLVIIVLNIGAYVGKEKMNKFYFSSGKKVISGTKKVVIWVTGQWKSNDLPEK